MRASVVIVSAALGLSGCASSTYQDVTSGSLHGNAAGVSGGSGGSGSGSGTTTGTTGAGCFTTNPGLDSGIFAGGSLRLPIDGSPSVGFVLGNQLLIADSCLGPPLNDGGCCLASEAVVTSLQQPPNAGTITLTDNGAALGELAQGLGDFYAYTGSALSLARPGDSLGFVAAGASFPAFSGGLTCPGPVTVLDAPPDGGLVSLSSDLTVTWLPDAGTPAVNITLVQTSGMESCFVSEGMLTLGAPLYVTCSVPTSRGSLTLPHSLFGDAGFVTGAAAQLTISGQSATSQIVIVNDQSPSFSEVQSTATAQSLSVPLVFSP
jgi:hypothetical protein